MSLLRPFSALDLFKFNNVNLDAWTETYSPGYYLQYLTTWPDLMSVEESADGTLMGYVMGKTEGTSNEWHGHVTAITVSPSYRRLGLAASMMALLERVSTQEDAWFVDLFVRVSNETAIKMYETFGYSVYRRVIGYYSGGVRDADEDAFDMRKSMPKDLAGESVRANGREVRVKPSECYF